MVIEVRPAGDANRIDPDGKGEVPVAILTDGGFDPTAIVGRLGKPWTLISPGVSIKPHPSGSLSHPAMAWQACIHGAST